MLYKNEEDFAKAEKTRRPEAQKPQGLYLLYGSETYLIESWAKKLTAAFGGDFGSFNLQRLDGRRLNGDALIDAVVTLPLMATEKCVLLDDLELKGTPPAELDKLTSVLEDLPPSCVLVITGKPGAFDPKSAAGKKIIKLCGEHGCAVELGSRSAGGMTTFLRGAAKRHGCELSPEVARFILQTCETDMGTLSTEIAKICAYAGGGVITREQVEAVAIPRTEARVFDLSKAILAGNTQRAMELLRDLFYLRTDPIPILATLSMAYVDLYRARAAKDGGHSPAEVAARFGYKGREFRINNAWNSRLSAGVLRASLQALLDADRRMKSTKVDSRILLEQVVVQLFLLQRKDG